MGAPLTSDPPSAAERSDPSPSEAPPPTSRLIRIHPVPGAHRARVLAIDDDVMIGRVIRRTLAREHDVLTLSSPKEALARIAEGERFDVIFCDLMMPEMSGFELYAEVLRIAPDQAECMVFLTGGAFTLDAGDFMHRVPLDRRLDKPFDINLLRAVVRARLPRR